MDKLRALRYFVVAARERSFSRAARHFGVSVPAVAKLVTSLERQLGARLLERSAQGIALTAEGESYLEACDPLLGQLAAAEEALAGGAARPRGTLVLAATPSIARACLMPALPRFHARYPDIQVDLRVLHAIDGPEAAGADVFIVMGWPERGDLVHRRIAQTRHVTCAAPAYWAARGVPARPRALEDHECLLFRGLNGEVLDLWQYEREGEVESAVVRGWLVSNQRDPILDAVLAGEGIARFSDITIQDHLKSGRLVAALADWESKDSPPVALLYSPSVRRTPRVRLFVEFATDLFGRLQADAGAPAPREAARPPWYRRSYRRASASMRG